MTRVAIIGAGMAGLAAAHTLKDKADIVLCDKSWRAGGRATTRCNDFDFDHGAQYFTIKTAAVRTFLEPWFEAGLIQAWNAWHARISNNEIQQVERWDEEHARYVSVPGMTQLGQSLNESFATQFETRITSFQRRGSQWQLWSDETPMGEFDWVILAIPAPQAEKLIPAVFCHRKAIASVEMRPCYTLMLGFESWTDLGFDAATVHDSDISWMAVNHSKPGRSNNPALVVHSTDDWAEQHLKDEREVVIEHMLDATQRVIGKTLPGIIHRDLHRWLYADTSKAAGEAALIDRDNKLVAIGDWCLSGRIESALASGMAVSGIIDEIQSSD